MNAVGNSMRRTALTMLLVLLPATVVAVAPTAAAGTGDPPPVRDQDTPGPAGVVAEGAEDFAPVNGLAPQQLIYCSTPNLAIPDNDPTGVYDEIGYIASFHRIADLDVYVNVSHDWVGDLVVTVEKMGSGPSVTIVDRPGKPSPSFAGCSGDDIFATLDDEAATAVEDECGFGVPTILGTFIPNNPLSAFDGASPGGLWRLTISDHIVGITGTLNEWCLVISAGEAYAVDSDSTDHLWTIDLSDGDATAIGPVGYGDVEALAFSPDGALYGVDKDDQLLLTIDTATGAGTSVGPLGVKVYSTGLAFDFLGNLWMVGASTQNLYSVNPGTGQATVIGPLGQRVTGLAARGMALYGLVGAFYGQGDLSNSLVTIDTATGAATPVGPLGTIAVMQGGLAFDAYGTLWGINDDNPGKLFQIHPAVGTAGFNVNITGAHGIESLAIPMPRFHTYLPVVLRGF